MQWLFTMVNIASVGASCPFHYQTFYSLPKEISCWQLLIKTSFVLWHLRPKGPRQKYLMRAQAAVWMSSCNEDLAILFRQVIESRTPWAAVVPYALAHPLQFKGKPYQKIYCKAPTMKNAWHKFAGLMGCDRKLITEKLNWLVAVTPNRMLLSSVKDSQWERIYQYFTTLLLK